MRKYLCIVTITEEYLYEYLYHQCWQNFEMNLVHIIAIWLVVVASSDMLCLA